MDCSSVQHQLIFYSENSVAPSKAKEIQQHLDACPDCRKQFEKIQQALSLIPQMKQDNPNPFLFTRIEQQIHTVPEKVAIPQFARIFSPVLVSLLLVATVLVGLYISNTASSSADTQEGNQTSVLAGQYHMTISDQDLLETYYLTEE